MTDKLKKIIEEEMENLPKEVGEAIHAVDWIKISEDIGKKYLIDDQEINDFQAQTALVLLGLRTPDLYAKGIENEVSTSKEEAEKIVSEAMEKIFNPIAEKIEEKIKNNTKEKDTDWDQNVNFTLSGGSYAVFLEQMEKAEEKPKPNIRNTTQSDNLISKFRI